MKANEFREGMTMKKSALIGVGLSIALAAGSTLAHHSAAQFDFRNTVEVTGIVKVAKFANPHGQFILEVSDDERGTRDVEFEAHSRNNMIRMQGLVPDMFKIGETVTLRIAPMRDGRDGGYVTGFVTIDGEEIGRVNAPD